ncbi:MAG: phosphoenolpyruvate carboxykinase (ATP) [Aggregatilineales bacterium]
MRKEHPRSDVGLDAAGLTDISKRTKVHWNLNPSEIYEYMLRYGDGDLTADGAIRVLTGKYTGRSPKDKYFVKQPGTDSATNIWWGEINQPCSQELFDEMALRVRTHLSKQEHLYVMDMFAGADPTYRLPLRVVTEAPYHALFSWNMFRRPKADELATHTPKFTILAAPGLGLKYEINGETKDTFIGADLEAGLIVVVSSKYSGELKKGIFSVMNYLLPKQGVMPMHCSANVDNDGNSAVFFGLSGTGKTTLSADASRTLIGDDEHGWSDDGIFNFEGGCYAKTVNLSPENEPEIYATTKMFGTILENVPLDENRQPDFTDLRYTQNTRCSYPIHYIPNASETAMAGHPKNVIFLTADAFGVLPPISKLTPGQAMYHFISGYTAKLAGTERGVTTPQATFSACFGAPFMPLHPTVYAELLAEKINGHGANVWLINTGWTGGAVGEGSRMKLKYTRRMVNAALNGELDGVNFDVEPFFGLAIPETVLDVPDSVLNPRDTWADKSAYDTKAQELAAMFQQNFEQFADAASHEILAGGPTV